MPGCIIPLETHLGVYTHSTSGCQSHYRQLLKSRRLQYIHGTMSLHSAKHQLVHINQLKNTFLFIEYCTPPMPGHIQCSHTYNFTLQTFY